MVSVPSSGYSKRVSIDELIESHKDDPRYQTTWEGLDELRVFDSSTFGGWIALSTRGWGSDIHGKLPGVVAKLKYRSSRGSALTRSGGSTYPTPLEHSGGSGQWLTGEPVNDPCDVLTASDVLPPEEWGPAPASDEWVSAGAGSHTTKPDRPSQRQLKSFAPSDEEELDQLQPCGYEEIRSCDCCVCRGCGSTSIRARKNKSPTYACNNPSCDRGPFEVPVFNDTT